MGVGLLLTAVAAYGQPRPVIRHYTNENGLPANGIKGIELDTTTGYLWVGTQAGLVRFDGKSFQHFDTVGATTVPTRINYIGKNREGIIHSEDDKFSVYRLAGNRPHWVATDSFLVARYMFRGAGSNPEMPAGAMVANLRQAPRSAWLPPWLVFHEKAGDSSSFSLLNFDHINYYDAAEDALYDFPEFEYLLQVGAQAYYARSNLDLWTFDKSRRQLVRVVVSGLPRWKQEEKEKPRFIWAPGMEAPLLIYQEDIWTLQGSGLSLRAVPFCQACCPPRGYITSAQVWKQQGMIFLGSAVNGLYVVKTPFLKQVRSDTTAEAAVEYAQAEIVPGIVNTSMGLAYSAQGRLLPGQRRLVYPKSNIYQDRQGAWWYNARDTLFRFDPRDNRLSTLLLKDGASKMVFAETRGRLYVITDKDIGEIAGRQFRPLYQLPFRPGSLNNALQPTAAIEWQPGILAIATEKLLFFDTEKGIPPDTLSIPGLSVSVRSLLKYGDYLFIGTYGQGFYVYKNGVVKKMPLDKNRYLAYAHCFMPDEQGYCWISTNHGLFKASLRALTAAYEDNLEEIYYHYFGKDDGISNTEFNGGCQPCALQLSNALFSFPTMNGVAVFDPRQPHTPPPSGRLFIDEVLADSRVFQPGDSALQTLSYQLQNLRVRVNLPYFGNSENVYFSYKLVPYNGEWETQDVLQNRTLQFGGLRPGRYTLYLRVRNGYGPDEFGTTTFQFRILPPWYQSWWAYTLCVLGFLALIASLVRWRTARINKRKQELQRLVERQTHDIAAQSRQLESQLEQLQQQQERLEEDNTIKARLIAIISHDLISPLKFMGYMGKKLRDGFAAQDSRFRTAEYITNVARDLESLSVNMLNWIRFRHGSVAMQPETFNLRQLVAESVEIPAALAGEKGVRFYNEVPDNTVIRQYRQAIGVIVYNLSMNACKHTAAGEIRIDCHYSPHDITLVITDTGMGMPPELVERLNLRDAMMAGYTGAQAKKYQFGFLIIKDLLRLIGGQLFVESSVGAGTKVAIKITLAP